MLSLVECLTGHTLFGAASMAGGIVFAWGASRTAAALAVGIPASCATVGAIVKNVLKPGNPGLTEQETWEALRIIIADQLDVPPDAVTPGASLVSDLGAD